MSNRLPQVATFIAVIALAACSGYGSTPDATVTAAPTAVPTATTATITVRYQGNLLYNQPVELHSNTGTTAAPVIGPVLQTLNTDPNTAPTGGQVTFTGLNPTSSYCWQYHYTPSGGTQVTASFCTDQWGQGFTLGS